MSQIQQYKDARSFVKAVGLYQNDDYYEDIIGKESELLASTDAAKYDNDPNKIAQAAVEKNQGTKYDVKQAPVWTPTFYIKDDVSQEKIDKVKECISDGKHQNCSMTHEDGYYVVKLFTTDEEWRIQPTFLNDILYQYPEDMGLSYDDYTYKMVTTSENVYYTVYAFTNRQMIAAWADEMDSWHGHWDFFANGIVYEKDGTINKQTPDTHGGSSWSSGLWDCVIDQYTVHHDAKYKYEVKAPGTYIITLKALGNYKGTITSYFTIPMKDNSEKLQSFLTTLYSTTLNRTPDAEGLNYWMNVLSSGTKTGTQVVNNFIFGSEFTAKNYCNEHFLTHLYKAIFSRDSDAAGLKYWEDKMSAGMTREEALNGFLGGKEFKALCDNAGISVGTMPAVPARGTIQTWTCPLDNKMDNGIGNFVLRMYTTCLGRDAEKEGASYWISQLNANKIGGTAVAEKFFMGKEFTNKKLSDSDYLERLYATIFDRPSDASGKSYWLKKLQSGSSRKDVLYGFASGTEWTNICKNYGIKK